MMTGEAWVKAEVSQVIPAVSQARRADGRCVREALELALTDDGPEVARLSYAHTSVRFLISDTRESTTLHADRHPPEISQGDEPGEITIELSEAQATAFARGALPIPTAVVDGSVVGRGPIQKYLAIDPIVRLLLRRTNPTGCDLDEAILLNGATSESGPLDPSLLALETRDLCKSFAGKAVLAGLNLTIPEGVISVVLGPSGTGKSVLLQHIIGLMRADAGDVLVRGRAINRMSRPEVLTLRRDIGVMFQDGALFSGMSVFDNVAFPLRKHSDLTESEVREVVMGHLIAVGLASDARKMPNMLSGGMRKRAGLARAFVLEPSIVLCDEPDSGLDPVRTALLADLLDQRHAAFGGTMVVVTHNVALAKQIADHISVLWKGTVIESGPAHKVVESKSEFLRQFLAGETRGPLGMDA
jgi:phospholipid/cholesterol/gamma-HCH transport system ATP-binding protein